MILAEERKHLEELRARVPCQNRCACMDAALTDLCAGRYHPDIDVLECLVPTKPPCKFARPFGCTLICTCPVRRYIAQHFSTWAAESTSLLKTQPDCAKPADA